ncbi:FAD:protein FMN transferase [Limnohabitans radicicola]|uniref:FAD:protein FMN transferase n=1 Tax=Limnohabitans radicicola TaxID=2771427 RepID=A0A927IIK0_9BURK|nr:FAD:protein FMN transferase [Limnohabitans radicicola]MBD8049699.1 FAD:protein FMN transferase [Limnohabitans radicicola]
MHITTHRFKAMGGPAQVLLPDTPQAPAAMRAVHTELQRLEAKYSRYKTDSLLSKINAHAGQGFTPCDNETWALLDYAEQLHERSGGLFDITSGVYRQVWNFELANIPNQDSLQSIRTLVGWSDVVRQNHQIALPRKGMEIDLGGLVKEYAVDRACMVLQSHGIDSALVSLAGDMRTLGTKPDGQPWQAGIAHPRQPGQLFASIELHNMALATSGDYERAIVLNGQRYAHIIHPGTGWPVSHWQSVSVQADNCLMAGSLCTMAMLMQEQGLELLQQSGLSFLAIGPTGEIFRNTPR